MRLLAGIIFAGFLTLSGISHACTTPPKYLPSEFRSDDIELGNIVKRADKIVLGKYIGINKSEGFTLSVSKSLKPDRNFFFKRKEKVLFTNVKQRYIHRGLDDNAFVSAEDLFRFISVLKSNSQYSSNLKYGVGGILSGISHGSDCERFVMMFDGQQYLVFLDSENLAIAQFGISSENTLNLKALLTKIDSALVEHMP